MPKPIPTDALDKLVYDESSPSGLRWAERTGPRVPADLRAGSLAKSGYWSIRLDGSLFYAHRLIWAMHHGDPGDLMVDHINQDTTDNRIANLQAISQADNTARRTGKGWTLVDGKYQAQIKVGGRNTVLGRFDTEAEARAAYVQAKLEIASHLNPQI